ncbi:phosphatidylglycerol--membrane-oligosaccharide glycerophosphotransferase [Rahnella sp. AA]|uniref:phosphatidylglycerol--membrane-oligosaccharide glycerophosphotransferase n=1 Tax=Rahnella sp. AA TaxID=2057180 RepID=UPI000C349418|nr:phosphatidylglycerol--membrane-oligosaccharide glycerophosphotransferase [Rahnella sp. AA]PKE30153.1 phosphatidylglycerol--membrane-oligosaccharide glycerophosphotransferase [Rahnella sp. AA]
MVSEMISFVLFLSSIFLYITRASASRVWFSLVLFFLGLYVILNVILIGSNYFTGDGITDAVLYTVTSSLKGAGLNKYILPFIGLLTGLITVFALLAWGLKQRRAKNSSAVYSVLAVVLAVFSVGSTQAFQNISRLVKTQITGSGADFTTYYKVPEKIVKGAKKPNLVYIYGESLERTYFDDKVFPGLTTELSRHKAQSIDFTNTKQVPGTGYTIAGMVASQCGIPLFAPFDGNASSALSTFYPENVCLGDVLKGAGYTNYFYQGAELAFAGKGTFLKSHGFDHLYGYNELRPTVADPAYKNDWGWYDDTLLDEAYKKFVELSKEGKPFSLFALTVDTHHPDGFISRGCTRKDYKVNGKSNQSLSAVACSQQLLAAFIDKIKQSGYFDNTIIVVSSDHLAMNNTAYNILTKQNRKDLFFVIDGRNPVGDLNAAKRSTLDNGATVLDIMGGDNYIGLGRSGISATSMTAQFLNIDDKVNAWKPAVIKQWGFPNSIKNYTVNNKDSSFTFSGMTIKTPFILKVTSDKIEPMFDVYLSTPLKKQLAGLATSDNFVWVDKCYEMGRVWAPELSLNTGLCVASGNLGAKPSIVQVSGETFKGKVDFSKDTSGSNAIYQKTLAALNIDDEATTYQSPSIAFMVPGLPEQVKAITGVSTVENWGRWSDANLAPAVKIDYVKPLPETFDVVIRARAYGKNIDKPVSVRVGDQEQFVTFGSTDGIVKVQFTNPDAAQSIVITPPEPTEPTEGTSGGFEPPKLGIGMVSLEVQPVDPQS